MMGKYQTFSPSGNLPRCMAEFDGIDTLAISIQIGGGFVHICNRADEEVTNLVGLEERQNEFDIDVNIWFPD
jgi:hypothetical protein